MQGHLKKSRPTFASRKAAKRARQAAVLSRRGIVPARTIQPAKKKRAGAGLIVLYALASVGLHVTVPLVAKILPEGDEPSFSMTSRMEKVVVRIKDPPKILEPLPLDEAMVDTAIDPASSVEPSVTKPKRAQRPVKKADADPIDKNEPKPETRERRRVVGISMESTVEAGAGPSFAVGNTRMGETAKVAGREKNLGKAVSDGSMSAQRALGGNELAKRIPTAGVTFKKPVRKRPVVLDYPKDLKVRGIEGNVVVLLKISVTGQVESVKILRSSGFDQFDSAAEKAALKESYSPAMRGGEPVEYSLKYTYRFRITGA